MAKKKRPQKKKPASEMRQGGANPSEKSTGPSPDQDYFKRALLGSREIIESIVIAFVLAFLVRTFEVEAFVIPTGSMADTLVGRHKDVICPECKFPFRSGASSELPKDGSFRPMRWCTCPNCRYTMDVSKDNSAGKTYPSYSGDRILVGKFPFEPGMGEPKRFDVIVFKYPGNAKTNYIKRLVGLPNETVFISGGDLFVKKKGDEEFAIARKSPGKLRAMMRVVHDNDYLATKLVEKNWPARWQSFTESATTWNSDDQQLFQTNGASDEELWLRYQHFVPKQNVWDNIDRNELFIPEEYVPRKIHDFTAYNENSLNVPDIPPPEYIVGDLAIECELKVKNSLGEAVFELVEDGRKFQCRFDLSTGIAKLSLPGKPAAQTIVQGPGTYQVFFANADDKLYLWVNDEVVQFNDKTTYNPWEKMFPMEKNDSGPVGIASAGGAQLQVNHLRVHRDLYYIDESNNEFEMGDDQFFVLGDNSAKSADGRFWFKDKWKRQIGHTVDRKLLIGKALYIYWPHSFDRVTLFGKEIWFPFFPNFSNMKLVQ